MVNLTTRITFHILTYMHLCVWGILRMLSACAPTSYQVVRDCRKLEKHCSRGPARKLVGFSHLLYAHYDSSVVMLHVNVLFMVYCMNIVFMRSKLLVFSIVIELVNLNT
jgi:hypothetical protein